MAIKNKLATQDFAKEVVYAPANLTPEQQAQAQKNIGLPEITLEDAGLVLGVSDEGKWELNLVGGGGGEGSGVQSDWNVSNKSSLAYIKNKPFYEETNAWVPLVPSTEFSPFNLMSGYGVYAYDRRAEFDGFAIGETYRITWDGITYECVAQDSSGVIANSVACGNCAPFGLSGNGEPFIIAYTANDRGEWETYCALTDTADGGVHTVGIEGIGTVVHKIEPKYIHTPDWNVTDKNAAGYIANKPFDTEYKTVTEGVFYDEKYDSDGDGVEDTWSGELFALDSSDANLEIGNFYDVELNGIKYTGLECFILESAFPCIGNGAYAGGLGDPNCPFLIGRDVDGLMSGQPMWMCILMDEDISTEDGTYSYKISGNTYKHLDNRYLSFITAWDEQEILPVSELQFSLEDESQNLYVHADTSEVALALNQLQAGRTYDLTCGEYHLSAQAKDITSMFPTNTVVYRAVGMGNLGIIEGNDTGEPFLAVAYDIYLNGRQQLYAIFLKNYPFADETNTAQIGIKLKAGGLIKEDYLPPNLKSDSGNSEAVTELPPVSTADNNKVLTVVNGSWAAAKAPSGLPNVTTSDNNKVLKVVNGSWAVADSLPTVTTDDAGKFLRVSSEGTWIVEDIIVAEEVSF